MRGLQEGKWFAHFAVDLIIKIYWRSFWDEKHGLNLILLWLPHWLCLKASWSWLGGRDGSYRLWGNSSRFVLRLKHHSLRMLLHAHILLMDCLASVSNTLSSQFIFSCNPREIIQCNILVVFCWGLFYSLFLVFKMWGTELAKETAWGACLWLVAWPNTNTKEVLDEGDFLLRWLNLLNNCLLHNSRCYMFSLL